MTITLIEKGNTSLKNLELMGLLSDVIPSNLVHNNVNPTGWANRSANSPFIDEFGYRVRAPGTGAVFELSEVIQPLSGWHSIHIVCQEPSFLTHVAIGEPAEALASVDLASSTDRLMILGSTGWFNGSPVVFDPCDDYVVAINYSGTNPIVYIIRGGVVVTDQTLITTNELQIIFKLDWQAIRGWTYEVNTGADLTNRPMPANIESLLDTYGANTLGFQLGVNGSNPGQAVAESVMAIQNVPGSPAVNDTVTLNCTCTQLINGVQVDHAAECKWRNEGENYNFADGGTVGDEYVYTIPALGRYPISVTYDDHQSRETEVTAVIFCDGTPTQETQTVWNASVSHPNIDAISTNQVRFGTEIPYKLAAIANQAMWGAFKYFELTIETDDTDSVFGVGLTTILNGNVMWSGAASGDDPGDGAGAFSLVTQAPGALGSGPLVWNNGSPGAALNGDVGWESGATGMRFGHGHTIGFAVDYLDKTALPQIYIIALDHTLGTPKLFGSFRLRNCRSPVHPMCYANVASNETVTYDVSINGGASAFQFDAAARLTAVGVSTTSFQNFWSDNDPP